ncbi:hypothetical protein HN587_01315 [Candidatus Woesearchaeota archaeon]|jgi:tRNA A-37 threonylcarbamoyl transferase component Bud32|nr:hypothetical protein [Candidatus Woesearchaeota archaeon]
MFTTLDLLIEQGKATSLDGGYNHCFLVSSNGSEITYKVLRNIPFKKRIRQAELKLLHLVFSQIPSHAYMLRSKGGVISREVETLKIWKSQGIPSPQVLDYSVDSIACLHIPGHDYDQVLKKPFADQTFTKLVETISAIRKLAFDLDDPNLLHPDMRPHNFVYSSDFDLAYAIDPGMLIRQDLSVSDVDSRVNLFFCFSMLAGNYPGKVRYVEQFLDSIEKPQLELMRELNQPLGLVVGSYLTLRERAGNFVRQRRPTTLFEDYNSNVLLVNDLIRNCVD